MTSAEQIASGQFSLGLLIGLFLKLGLVLLLIYFSLYLVKRYGLERKLTLPMNGSPAKHNGNQTIETLAVKQLNRQVTLYLLRINQEQILLSVSATGETRLLSTWPGPQPEHHSAQALPFNLSMESPHDTEAPPNPI